MVQCWNDHHSTPVNHWNLQLTFTSSKPQTHQLQQNMSCGRASSMPCSSSTNQIRVSQSSHSSVFISVPEHFHKKQNLWKSQSHFFRSYWSASKGKWSLCHNFLNADWNCPSLSENHEKWASSFKNSCYIHYSKNPLWWKGPCLYLCYSVKIFCCINRTQQYAKGAYW